MYWLQTGHRMIGELLTLVRFIPIRYTLAPHSTGLFLLFFGIPSRIFFFLLLAFQAFGCGFVSILKLMWILWLTGGPEKLTAKRGFSRLHMSSFVKFHCVESRVVSILLYHVLSFLHAKHYRLVFFFSLSLPLFVGVECTNPYPFLQPLSSFFFSFFLTSMRLDSDPMCSPIVTPAITLYIYGIFDGSDPPLLRNSEIMDVLGFEHRAAEDV